MRNGIYTLLVLGLLLPTLMTIAACSGIETEADYPMDPDDRRRARHGKLTGEDGLSIFGNNSKSDNGGGGSQIGVNSYLWRASLDTLSFMPLSEVDPHGGVIITDWYEDPSAQGERFKVNVFILGTQLTATGVRVSAFKQEKDEAGEWRDASINAKVGRDLENSILTRARELRIDSAREG